MATISLRGIDALTKHFVRCNHSYWKLYNAADLKSPIQICITEKNVGKSLELFNDIIGCIDPAGTYILDTFAKSEDGEKQNFLKPSTSLCFSLSDKPVENTAGTGEPIKGKNIFDTPASLKDHIALIEKNAKLEVECSMYKSKVDELLEENKKLKVEIEELYDELDEYEEEEDDEEESISGEAKPPKNMEEAFARLMTEHGGAIIENVMSKSTKEKVNFDEDKEEGEIKVNGITQEMPSITEIIKELEQRTPNLQKYLYKLLIIAREKPNTYNIFLKKLQDF